MSLRFAAAVILLATLDTFGTLGKLLGKEHAILFFQKNNNVNESFATVLKQTSEENDFFYTLLGHPHDDAANKLQLKSHTAVTSLLGTMQLPCRGAVINNDITGPESQSSTEPQYREGPHHGGEHGLFEEPAQSSYWGSTEWLMDYGTQELDVNWEKPDDHTGADFDFLGMEVHSWNDCQTSMKTDATACIHVLQVRNYQRFYPANVSVEHLGPVFNWMARDLDDHEELPIAIVFQEFEGGFADLGKGLEAQVLGDKDYNILGTYFSMMSNNVSIDGDICLGEKHLPTISLGAIPPSSYLMLQFNPDKKGLRKLYEMNVSNDTATVVFEMDQLKKFCL